MLTVPPAVMLMCSSTSREKITCDPNSKPVPNPVNVRRLPKSYFILTISTQNILLQLMMLDFVNNFPNILCLKLNHCTIVLYVNYLALHRISLCLLNLFTLAHCLKPYHLSLLERSQNFSHPYHPNLPIWTIYLHLSLNLSSCIFRVDGHTSHAFLSTRLLSSLLQNCSNHSCHQKA